MTERSTGPAPAWDAPEKQAGWIARLFWSGAHRAARWIARPTRGVTHALRKFSRAALRRRGSTVRPAFAGMPRLAFDGPGPMPCGVSLPACSHPAATTRRGASDVYTLLDAVLLPGLVAWHQSLPGVVDQRVAGELARRLLGPTGSGVRELIAEHYVAQGSLHRVFSGLVEPAARRLGDLWSADHCSEADITIAMCRLLAELRQLDGDSRGAGRGGRAALVVPQPGEPHMLGAALDAESLWQAGWLPRSEYPEDDAALQALVAERHYDVLCIALSPSFSRVHRLDRLAQTIARARATSRNPGIVVVVSGRAFHEDRQAARRVGADGSSRWASRFDLLH